MGYGEIDKRLAAEATSETYRDWITTYASDDYQRGYEAVGEFLDSALKKRFGADFETPPRWNRLCHTFRTATELEINFWQMGLTP